jgi:CheY-like chemotaxis protein
MPNTSKIVVLIADDEPSTVAMLSSHLRSGGYAVLEASDGDQAWELAHEHLPHLVILDVMMPGMSGWEVCRKIREAVSLAHTGVIMLTGIGESLNEMTSPLYGADAHVDKPFEFAKLDAKIKETLQARKQGALGRPDSGGDDASMVVEEDDLPTLPPSAPKRAPKAATPKPLAKTKPAAAPKPVAEKPKKEPKKAAPAKAPAPAKKAEKKAAAPAPAKKAPAAKKAAKKAPAKKAAAPAKKAPAAPKKAAAPAKKPSKKAPAKKAPAAAKKPAKKAPAKKAPAAAKKPAKKAPAKKAPAAAKKKPGKKKK